MPLATAHRFGVLRRTVTTRSLLSGAGVVGVVAAAAGLVVADLLGGAGAGTAAVLPTAAVLCGAAVLHHETTLAIEWLRRRPTGSHHVDLNSVWTFAGTLLLPSVAAAAVVVLLHLYLHLRVQRPLRAPAPRHLYRVATGVLAVYAATAVLVVGWPAPPFGPVAAALLAFGVVRTGLVLAAVAASEPGVRTVRTRRTGHELMLGLAALCLGGLAAGLLRGSPPFMLLLLIPPILALHRTTPLRRLEESAETDAKTGLLNAAGWHSRAGRALRAGARDGTVAGLLVLDLDLFKSVNDRLGHLAGDQVLGAIASALRAEVRGHDLVGRFGGEEFVVLLPRLSGSADREEVRRIGHRLRRRVGEVRVEIATPEGARYLESVTVSVGGAVYPGDGDSLVALIETADSALYAAKRAGRDTVRIGRHGFGPAEPGDRRPAPGD